MGDAAWLDSRFGLRGRLSDPDKHCHWSYALLAAVLGALGICVALLVYGSGRGFDLTDETFYLIWIRNPNAYELIYQPFGYLLHPLFELVAGNIQWFRLAGFALAASAGAFLGYSLAYNFGRRLAFVPYGAAAGLTAFFPWIITPSYNSTADVGAMLIIGGILVSLQQRRSALVIGAAAAGAGMCLAAFAKPPLFALSVALTLFIAFIVKRGRLAHIAALALALALMSLFLSPLEMPALVRRIIVSQHVLALPNTPLRLPAKALGDWYKVPLPLSLGAASVLLSLALRQTRWFPWLGYAAVAFSVYYLGSVVSDALDGSIPDFIGLALVMLDAGYACILQHEKRSHWSAIALLIAAPVAVALGTFNNQWFQLNFSLPFPFIALFALASADPVGWRSRAAFAVAVIGPPATMLLAASAPYSLPASVFEQQVPVRPPIGAGTLLVDQETAAFISESRGLARDAPLIDLSGAGPGVAAVLGGRAPVLPWLNPATSSWPHVVWSRLSPQERREAWFVVPVWPQFAASAPARWVNAHKSDYCTSSLPEMPFWGEERVLEVLRPCPAS